MTIALATALFVLLTITPDGHEYVSDSNLSKADCIATAESFVLPEGFEVECVEMVQ